MNKKTLSNKLNICNFTKCCSKINILTEVQASIANIVLLLTKYFECKMCPNSLEFSLFYYKTILVIAKALAQENKFQTKSICMHISNITLNDNTCYCV